MGAELENYIRGNLNELDREKPDAAVLGRILEEMKVKNESPGGIVIPFRVLKWAAACIFIAVCGVAWWYFKKQPATEVSQTNMPEQQQVLHPIADSVKPATVVADENIAAHKKIFVNKVKAAQTISFAALYNMQSAADRINAVASTSRLKNIDKDVVDALVQTLNNDPNTNVRLAALDGLTRFYREVYVRKKLVASLKKQHDPMVQINLIALLTRIRELSILSYLEKMVNDENTNKDVKDYAWSGILQLRSENN